MCVMMSEIKTIDVDPKDALFKKANIKKIAKLQTTEAFLH